MSPSGPTSLRFEQETTQETEKRNLHPNFDQQRTIADLDGLEDGLGKFG